MNLPAGARQITAAAFTFSPSTEEHVKTAFLNHCFIQLIADRQSVVTHPMWFCGSPSFKYATALNPPGERYVMPLHWNIAPGTQDIRLQVDFDRAEHCPVPTVAFMIYCELIIDGRPAAAPLHAGQGLQLH